MQFLFLYLYTIAFSLSSALIINSLTDPSTTISGNCTTGDVRFVNFTDRPYEDSRQGTIRICINNVRGFICGDDFFDDTDASVFCGQLEGFSSIGYISVFDFVLFNIVYDSRGNSDGSHSILRRACSYIPKLT